MHIGLVITWPLTAGIGAIEQMLCEDAQQLAGAPHSRGGGRVGQRWGTTKGRVGFHGGKVARAGWNGKGMFLVYQKGYPDGIPINKNTADATGIPQGTVCKFLPYIMMRTAQGDFVPHSRLSR